MLRSICLTFLALAFVLINSTSLFAKDIYVNNAIGHDRNLGQSGETADGLAGPVRTINRAIELSGQGDRIILVPTDSPYRETICLFGARQSGDDFNAFTIEGNGAILDGRERLPLEAWSHAFGNTFRFRPTRFTHFQLYLEISEGDNRPLKRVAVEPEAKTPPQLSEMEWCICNGFVYLCLENFKRPQDYRFSYSDKMTGITIMQTNDVRINDLIVQGYQIDGISVVNNTKNVIFDNVIVRGNGRNGLTVGASSTVSVGYSMFGDNAAAQVEMANRSEVLLFLCELKGEEEPTNTQKSPQTAQWTKATNNGGTLRQIGPDGVQAAEASQKPDIANLWGKLVLVSVANQPTVTPPSKLMSATQNATAEPPTQQELPSVTPDAVPDTPGGPEPTPEEPEDSPFDFGREDDFDFDDSPFGFE